MMRRRVIGKVETEGDTLFYKITGIGRPLLLIAGGGGDGDFYLPLADELANHYKVITYDRRANARSTMNSPDHFDISQQARDALAVLKAAGETAAIVFGNSSGAVIAIEMARLFPDHVAGVIVHEPPIARLHPERDKWRKFFSDCYKAAFKFGGASGAATKFMFGIEVPVMQMTMAQRRALRYLKGEPKNSGEKRIPSKSATKFFIEQELIKVTDYNPDIEFIKNHKDKYIIAVGTYAVQNNTFLFQISKHFSELIDKPFVVVPGHHGSFMDDISNWAKCLFSMIDSFTK